MAHHTGELRVVGLYEVPLRGAACIPVEEMYLHSCGPVMLPMHDRNYAIQDTETGKICDLLRFPELGHVRLSLSLNHVNLKFPNAGASIHTSHWSNDTIEAGNNDKTCRAHVCVYKYANYMISQYLGGNFRLIRRVPESGRYVTPEKAPVEGAVHSFGYSSALTFTSQEAIDELERRAGYAVGVLPYTHKHCATRNRFGSR